MEGVHMSKHVKTRPVKGSKNDAAILNGAAVSNSTEHEHSTHPTHTKCDTPNPLVDRLVTLVGVLAVLALSTIAFIALHWWGIGDSHSVNFLSAFTGAALSQLR